MSTSGYSGTPLAKKLGIKAGHRLRTSNAPHNYAKLIDPLPDDVTISTRLSKDIDIWHFFSNSADELDVALPRMMRGIRQNGMIWVSWPKKASRVPSDITEDTVRELALPLGLVDIKVCAVDEVWSGLKLVIRKELRSL